MYSLYILDRARGSDTFYIIGRYLHHDYIHTWIGKNLQFEFTFNILQKDKWYKNIGTGIFFSAVLLRYNI